jgi:hypothetical protein
MHYLFDAADYITSQIKIQTVNLKTTVDFNAEAYRDHIAILNSSGVLLALSPHTRVLRLNQIIV